MTNEIVDEAEVKSYASSSSKAECPNILSKWQNYQNSKWVPSDSKIECIYEWTKWSECDCESKTHSRNSSKILIHIIESNPCNSFNVDIRCTLYGEAFGSTRPSRV